MNKNLSFMNILPIGLMLFSLFFGAGNLIFPPALGQLAGEHLFLAIFGFLCTGVGLPLMGILAIARMRDNSPFALANKVNHRFSVVLMVIINLIIGPLFAIPRTAAVAFDIGLRPFIAADLYTSNLAIYTLLFFGATYYFALSPNKLIDRVGKILTPLLLITLGLLISQIFFRPLGAIGPSTATYENFAFFKGFQEGYLTMDLLASVVFGSVVINSMKAKGVNDTQTLTKVCIYAGLIASFFLAVIYISLAYMGATSVELLGYAENGGLILSGVANHYFGAFGNTILFLTITFACLTTSIGLVSSCAGFFSELSNNKITYQRLVLYFSLFSFLISNVGLTKLITISVPFLVAVYPVVIMLILLVFLDKLFGSRRRVYQGAIFFTACVSVLDALQAIGMLSPSIIKLCNRFIPLYIYDFGWLIPAAIGGLVGYIYSYVFETEPLLTRE